MRVFVTGATGFIGSAVVAELLQAGHQVVGLARSEAAAAKLKAAGAEAHHGQLEDTASLAQAAKAADGVAHLAFIHDFNNFAHSVQVDQKAVLALSEAVESGKPLVIASVTAMLPLGRTVDERDAPDKTGPVAFRAPAEETALGTAARGVRATAVRLPPTVHGRGDAAFVPALIDIARRSNASRTVGDGTNRWPAVHRLDAARLFRLALERGEAGAAYHAVAETGIQVRDIAGLIAKRLELGAVEPLGPEQAGAHFGWLAGFLTLDNPVESRWTQAQLGWKPEQPGLLEDMEKNGYFDAPS